jgi:gliding motility-associated-like protein
MKIKQLILILPLLVFSFIALSQAQESSFDFNENKGQLNETIKYHCKLHIGDIYFKDNQFAFDLFSAEELDGFYNHKHHKEEEGHVEETKILNKHVYNMKFLGANSNNKIVASRKNSYYKNYYQGNNPEKWASNVQSYQRISYQQMYDGIDVNIYSTENHFKYDFIVAKGAQTEDIKIEYEGVESLNLVNGDLEIILSNGIVRELKPFAYQTIDGKEYEITCEFSIENNVLSFKFPNGYDSSKELIIDPTLVFATLSGSQTDNWGFTATYDDSGNFYAGSIALGTGTGPNFGNSANYPVTGGSYQTTFAGFVDVAISKFSANGAALLYSTYIGGNEMEEPHSLIVDDQDNLVIMGATSSMNFPVDINAYQSVFGGGTFLSSLDGINWNNGSDIFITKLNASGNALLGSTYLGGAGNDGLSLDNNLNFNYADHARGEVILDNNNNIYIASSTNSTNFPTTVLSHSQLLAGGSGYDGVVCKLDLTLNNLLWGTYIGGTAGDAAYSIRVDVVNGKTFVCGGTTSNNIGATIGVVNQTYSGANDGYIAKFDNLNGTLDALTYVGTNAYDQSYIIEVDQYQDIYVVGQTKGAYPVTGGVYSNPGSAQFIHKMNNDLTVTDFSTVFGDGSNLTVDISITAFLVDNCDNIYVSGWGGPTGNQEGTTNGLPITAGALQSTTDGRDFYFMVLDRNAQSLLYGTYFGTSGVGEHVDGGTSRFDKKGTIYQAVCAGCGGNNFPTTPGSYSTSNGSTNCNYGAVKIDMDFQGIIANANPPPNQVHCGAPYNLTFSAGSPAPPNNYWDFGDSIGTDTSANPIYTYADTGTYTVMYVAIDSTTCNIADTVYFNVSVIQNDSLDAQFTFPPYDPCTDSLTVQLDFTGVGADSLFWDMGDNTTFINDTSVTYTYTVPGNYVVTFEAYDLLCLDTFILVDTVFFNPTITLVNAVSPPDQTLCSAPYLVNFTGNNPAPPQNYWDFGDGFGTDTILNPSYTYADTGTYQVMYVVIDSSTCNIADTVYFNVQVNQNDSLDAQFTFPPYDQCTDSLTVQLDFTGTGADSLFWDMGNGTTFINDTSVTYTYTSPGTYVVTFEAYDFLCNNTQTVTDTVFFNPVNTTVNAVVPPSILLCDAPYAVNFTGNTPAPPNNYWDFGDFSGTAVDNNNPSYIYSVSGNYTVMYVAIDSSTCNIADTVYFPVSLQIAPVFSASIDFTPPLPCETQDSLLVDINFTGTGADSIYWNMGDGTEFINIDSAVYLYTTPGTYLLTMSVFNYLCNKEETVSSQITVVEAVVSSGIIPNVFTPNGDGMNDKLIFGSIDVDAEFDLKILNRWGITVFETTDPTSNWDGGNHESGTYFYILTYRDVCSDEEKQEKGFVSLLR